LIQRDRSERADGGLSMILVNVAEIIEDQQVISVEPVDRRLELQGLPCSLQLLDNVGGAGEQNTIAVLDKSSTDC
jgi:hypothetical protein